MNINATLLVQAVNFFIAYLLFRFILLKPAYAEIRQDEQNRASLAERIEQDKRTIEQEQQLKRDAWNQFHAWCTTYLPVVIAIPTFFKTTIPRMQMKEPREELKTTIRRQLTAKIIEQARDRYDG